MNSRESDAATESPNSTPPPLKDEFRSALLSFASAYAKGPLAGHSSTSDFSSFSVEVIHDRPELNPLLNDAIRDLRRIAGRMIAAGDSRACVRAYAAARKSAMDESFKILGIENSSAKIVQRLEWRVQQQKIRLWIRNAEICVRVLFAEERRLAEQIFRGLGNSDLDDACFVETVADHADSLFNFAAAISNGRKSPEKLFSVLDLYVTISNLLPDVKSVFQWKFGICVCKKAVDLLLSLANCARSILLEFEAAVIGEPTKFLIAGGSIHPLNTAVMDYIDSIVDYRKILTLLIVRKPLQIDLDFSTESSNSPLVLHLLCIIEALYLNLKAKSKHYKDAALSNFFVMNNVHYIVHRIRGSFELREMIGEGYTNRLADEYNLSASFYLNLWKGVFDCLEIGCFERLGGLFGGSFFSRLRFKAFQARFKEVVEAQSGWVLAEAELRKELRILVLEMIMPLYNGFLHRHGRNVERLKQFGNFCDVEKVVMCLFEG
ncbi:exocyst complex component EXO70A1-like [Salvia hispanica]|uniref:exocyst complex component EXO70A1-like n=1 Tax=Salvia hispanica TaxID=49212 RepID=UPI0020092FD1|nr:exocyst complex component EXO70A1-like [Salvia hispanica]